MDTNTVQVIQEFGTKLDGYITVLASKLGVAADHFWPIFVQQQVTEGWIRVVEIVLTATITFLMFRFGISYIEDANHEDSKTSCQSLVKCIIGFFAGVVMAIILLVELLDGQKALGQIINPEYYAVQTILNIVK